MKLDEFLALKQGDQTVMQYVGRFNHLSQYASEHVNTDAKKKKWFMRGLNTKLQTMMTTCTNVTYHEAVNIAIASEEKYRQHKELQLIQAKLRMCLIGNHQPQFIKFGVFWDWRGITVVLFQISLEYQSPSLGC